MYCVRSTLTLSEDDERKCSNRLLSPRTRKQEDNRHQNQQQQQRRHANADESCNNCNNYRSGQVVPRPLPVPPQQQQMDHAPHMSLIFPTLPDAVELHASVTSMANVTSSRRALVDQVPYSQQQQQQLLQIAGRPRRRHNISRAVGEDIHTRLTQSNLIAYHHHNMNTEEREGANDLSKYSFHNDDDDEQEQERKWRRITHLSSFVPSPDIFNATCVDDGDDYTIGGDETFQHQVYNNDNGNDNDNDDDEQHSDDSLEDIFHFEY